jgi:superfamily II DNA or RNA helicase
MDCTNKAKVTMSGFRVFRVKGSPLWGITAGYYSPKLIQVTRLVPGAQWDSEVRAHIGYADAIEQIVRGLRDLGLKSDDPPESSGKWAHNLPVSYESARDYQKEGIDFLINQAGSGALLADDMGVGKSFQAVKAARAFRRKTVIVCPAHVRGVWEREPQLDDKGGELAKWWPKAKVVTPYGLKAQPIPADSDVVVIHYDIVHAWVDVLLEWSEDSEARKTVGVSAPQISLKRDRDLTVIFDEAHVLLNPASRRSKACRELAHAARGRIALTGTPPTERVRDLYNIVDTISPGRFGEFFGFAKRYCCPPEAPVWMSDMSFKPIGEVRPGDEVIGWDEGARGASPKKKQDTKGRGNRHVGGAGRGGKQRKLVRSRVLEVGRRIAPIVKVTLESGRVVRCTSDHRWLSGAHSNKKNPWTRVLVGHHLAHVIDVPRALSSEEQQLAFWLGGLFDGEGDVSNAAKSRTRAIGISQSPTRNKNVCVAIERAFTALGFDFGVSQIRKDNPCVRYTIGGRQTMTNFLSWCAPVRRSRVEECILGSRFKTPDRIVSIEPDGAGEVVSLTTTTGNYVVWGYASKNCDAKQIEVPGPENTKKTVWDFSGRSNLSELRQRLNWFCLRRTKREVMQELPALQRQIVDVDVPPKHRVAMNARLVGDKRRMRAALDSAADGKLKSVLELARGHLEAGMRVVVGTYRRAVCERISDALDETAPTRFIHGGIPLPRRPKIIDELRRTEGPCCLVANIDCASTGIDLTFASVAVMAELVWEPRDLVQYESRLHRFGQEGNVLVQYVIARGTGDELILQAVIGKLDNFLDLVETDKGDGLKEALEGEKDEGLSRLAVALKKMGAKNTPKKQRKEKEKS